MPFLSKLEVVYDDALYKSTFTYLLTYLLTDWLYADGL